MKRLLRKDNRIGRIVALWLVFIMALTPLYQHSGLKNPTKAATPGSVEYTLELDVTGPVDPVLDESDAIYSWAVSEDTEIHNIKYLSDDQGKKLLLKGNATGVLNYKDNTNVPYTIKAKVYNNNVDEIPANLTGDGSDLKALSEIQNMEDGQIYAVYVRVDEFKYGFDVVYGTSETASSANNLWHLVGAYKVSQTLYSDIGWVDASGAKITTASAKEAYVPNVKSMGIENPTTGDILVGDLNYYYVEGTETVYDNITPADFQDAATGAAHPGADGESCVLFITYKGDSDETLYKSVGHCVNIDTAAPTLSTTKTTTITGPDGLESAENGVYYLDKNSNYTLAFYTDESNSLSKLSVNFYKQGEATPKKVDFSHDVEDGTNVYKKEKFTSGLSGKYEVKVLLTDEAGNTTVDAEGNPLETTLATICVIDPTLNISCTPTGSGIKSPAKEQQEISVTVSSGDALDRIELTRSVKNEHNADIDEVIETISLTDVQKVDGLYSATKKLKLPPDSMKGDDQKLKNVKVKVYESGENAESKPKTIYTGELVYDVTEPNVEAKDTYKDSVADENKIPGNHFVLSKDTDKCLFGFSANDTGSGIKSIEVYANTKDNHVATWKGSTENGVVKINELGYSDMYWFELDDDSIRGDFDTYSKVAYYVEVIDNADNPTLIQVGPTISDVEETLTIDEALLTVGNDGTQDIAVNITADSTKQYNYCKAFKLRLTTSSAFPIDKINITNTVTDLTTSVSSDVVINSVTITDDVINPDTGRYTATCEILIPNNVNENTLNMLLKSVKVTVTDERKKMVTNEQGVEVPEDNHQTTTRLLGDLLYDATKPVITDAAGSPIANDYTWVKADVNDKFITMDTKASIGPQNATPESKLSSFWFGISNSINDQDPHPVTGTMDTEKTSATMTVTFPESKSKDGTKVTLKAKDEAGNEITQEVIRMVDATAPKTNRVAINGKVVSGVEASAPIFNGKIKIDASSYDNLSIGTMKIEIKDSPEPSKIALYSDMKTFGVDAQYDGTGESGTISRDFSFQTDKLKDGYYYAVVTVVDKAGFTDTKIVKFEVDNSAPLVEAKVTSGKQEKTPDYYNSDIVVTITSTDKNGSNIDVYDNNTKVNVDFTETIVDGLKVKNGTYTVKTDGRHNIVVKTKDGLGNTAPDRAVNVVRDTNGPEIKAYFNGITLHTDGERPRVFTANTNLSFVETDSNKDSGDFYYKMTKQVPDESAVVGSENKTAYRDFSYTEEAEYTVTVRSKDKAGNPSNVKTVQFRIDKTAPNISIGGIASGGTSANGVTVSLNMQELYWQDARGTVEIYRASGEGGAETLVEEIDYTPTGRSSVMTRSFAESGVYRIEFNAQDSAGHTATASSKFTVDTEAPKVTLEGVKNYDLTEEDVVISSVISDMFYASKKVTVKGTVTDINGKVSPLEISDYSATANPTTINHTFTEDGIYDLTISCEDVAGNTESKSVHFIIDKTDPVIGDLSKYDGKTHDKFEWEEDLDELVSDLTVCDVHVYLNGQEYNGEDAVEDGSYVMLITAEDELGHMVKKEVQFTVDTKAPVFIVTGVEDNEKKTEPYNISVSLQLEEDTLVRVTLNGKNVEDPSNIQITEVGKYKLYMEAIDEAGNEVTAEYEFELQDENQFNIWIVIGALALLAIIIIIILLKKKKN